MLAISFCFALIYLIVFTFFAFSLFFTTLHYMSHIPISSSPSSICIFSTSFLVLLIQPSLMQPFICSYTFSHTFYYPCLYHNSPSSLSLILLSLLLLPGLRVSVFVLCAAPRHTHRESESLWGSHSTWTPSRLLR